MECSCRFVLMMRWFPLIINVFMAGGAPGPGAAPQFDYADALAKNLLFLEAQRSGKLPADNRVAWRGDSGLQDGLAQGVNLEGGYYDAGDNVKFGFPMAFTVTMLAWSVIEYGDLGLSSTGQLFNTLDAIRWGTDYFIKAHQHSSTLWGDVGDGNSDHACWQRPEDMTTSRTAYKIDTTNPGSDLAGETSAALAASSIAFQAIDPTYSQVLLQHARQLFTFGNKYRGAYDNSITSAKGYYTSFSGYNDELLWASIWLYKATSEATFLQYLIENGASLGGNNWRLKEFSWDNKMVGVQILVSKVLLEDHLVDDELRQYQLGAEFYMCAQLQRNYGSNNTQRTPGGLLFFQEWNNLQYVTAAAFLVSVYADYLVISKQQIQCPIGGMTPHTDLLKLARTQIDYILGKNPQSMSYMVGYGPSYPQYVHHRGSSIVSLKVDPTHVTCEDGYAYWYTRPSPNPNILIGAVVGGPDHNDSYVDDRGQFDQSEPTTSTIGPLVGALAHLVVSHQQGEL